MQSVMEELDDARKQPPDQSSKKDTERTPLFELFEQVVREFDAAAGAKDGWGWRDVDLAIHLFDAWTKLRRWRDSVQGLAAEFYGVTLTVTDAHITETKFHDFLTHVECDRPFLSGTIRVYLDELLDVVRSIHTAQTMRKQDAYLSISELVREELDVSCRALSLQLDPLSIFVQIKTETCQSVVRESVNVVEPSQAIGSIGQQVQNVRFEIDEQSLARSKSFSEDKDSRNHDTSSSGAVHWSAHRKAAPPSVPSHIRSDISQDALVTSKALDNHVPTSQHSSAKTSPSSSSNGEWLWSEERRKYYRYKTDGGGSYLRDSYGQYMFEWDERNFGYQHSDSHSKTSKSTGSDRMLQETGNFINTQPQATSRVPSEHITGTPGGFEVLDDRYTVKAGLEERRFFKQGRVFAMLWTETAGETPRRRTQTDNSKGAEQKYSNPAISPGRFGENVYSQIRRFIVVKVNRGSHFVMACPITTYGQRGVMKPGCNAREHTIVHLRDRPPSYVSGEIEKGMTKDPLMIHPTDPTEEMPPESRLRLGKVVSVECNVKVRDIGMVIPEHRWKLLDYYQQEQDNGYEPDEYDVGTSRNTPIHPPFTHQVHVTPASSTQGAYYAPSNGYGYSIYPIVTHNADGLYPVAGHTGIHHGESQPHQPYPDYQYPPHQYLPYQDPPN